MYVALYNFDSNRLACGLWPVERCFDGRESTSRCHVSLFSQHILIYGYAYPADDVRTCPISLRLMFDDSMKSIMSIVVHIHTCMYSECSFVEPLLLLYKYPSPVRSSDVEFSFRIDHEIFTGRLRHLPGSWGPILLHRTVSRCSVSDMAEDLFGTPSRQGQPNSTL